MTGRPAVLLLGGSPSPRSHTAAAVGAAAGILAGLGAEPLVWDLAARPLPIVDVSCHGRPEAYADPLARRLSPTAARADALVLATPTYHGSFSGVLKNALDHLAGHELRGKPVGLLAHGENLTAVQVCDALRTVVRALKGMAVPEQLVTVPGDFDRVGNGQRLLTAPPALDRLDALCRSLVTVTRQLATGEAIGIGTA
ncbi:NADPH-dependent FMN reductase [Streptomyces hygroscopicus]|uniref:NADPH-dependent FMN reductase n=1 Tax=Streptomyces hygroscopicus TaxID=1912 RepID=UPI0007674037|nr:NADPH-dependent FMN reductase [Streptomyces hygroscopicus]